MVISKSWVQWVAFLEPYTTGSRYCTSQLSVGTRSLLTNYRLDTVKIEDINVML